MSARPRVVIVGAGFAGLSCARRLKRANADVLLVDRNNHHCFQPLLYQVATAALAPNDVAWPVRALLAPQRNTTVLMAEAEGVDRRGKALITNKGRLPYDYLVLATGATHSYFGHDAWAKDAPGLKTVEDAVAIRQRLLLAFETAEMAADPAEARRLLTFAVVGGGPTGVELAGAIAEMARQTLAKDFRRIEPRLARVLLLEAGPRLLSAYPEALSAYAARALARKGVEVQTNTMVRAIDADGLTTAAGRIDTGVSLWAAGLSASPAGRWVSAQTDRAGRIPVTPTLTLPFDDSIYAMGDTAAIEGLRAPIPAIAPAAKQMGRHVARHILSRLGEGHDPGPFQYRHEGDLATIGRNAAIVRRQRFELTGFPGWLFWSVAHIFFLIGARNRISVAFNWLWDYVTLQRSARLILRTPAPEPAAPPQGQAAAPRENAYSVH